MTSIATTVDVVVVGGGPAGCCAAAALLEAGFSVRVIDRPTTASAPGESVSAPAIRALAAAGFAPSRFGTAIRPWVGIRSGWGGDETTSRDFIAAAHGDGWHVDRHAFDADLRGAVRERMPPASWTSANRIAIERTAGPAPWRVAFDGNAIRARAAIDASGRSRVVARAAGARPVTIDRLVGWHGIVDCDADAPLLTFVEPAADGWWYGSPLPGGRAAICFLSDADLVRRGDLAAATRSEAALRVFDAVGAEATRWYAKPVPSGTSRLDVVAGRSWAAVGDAAFAHDPLSGQGLDFAFRSGRRAAAAVAAALHGDDGATTAYARMAATRANAMMGMRQAAYRGERRWSRHAFWQRRHGPSDPVVTSAASSAAAIEVIASQTTRSGSGEQRWRPPQRPAPA